MNIDKIKGILDAIDVESKQPQPSHANLARLTHMMATEILKFLDLICKGIAPLLSTPAKPLVNEPVLAVVSANEETMPNQGFVNREKKEESALGS